MYKLFKNVIFQEVLNILYFKIIPNISQKFDSNFGGPKLTHTLYSPFLHMETNKGHVSFELIFDISIIVALHIA